MKKQTRQKAIFVLIILLTILLSSFLYYIKLVSPVIKNYARAKINALTEKSLNLAVSNVINESLNYEKIIDLSYTSSGTIAYISANQYVVNSINREVVKNAQHNLISLGDEGINIPIGTFSGLNIFVGRGPNLKLRTMPVGIVKSDFKSKFTSVGINNTLHQLFLEISCVVELVMPIKNIKIESTQNVLLCESIIIGQVPEVYFGSDILKGLNLVPN